MLNKQAACAHEMHRQIIPLIQIVLFLSFSMCVFFSRSLPRIFSIFKLAFFRSATENGFMSQIDAEHYSFLLMFEEFFGKKKTHANKTVENRIKTCIL